MEERTAPEPAMVLPIPPPDSELPPPVLEPLPLPDELEDPEKAEEPLDPDDRRELDGTETVVERETLDSPGPCRPPRSCGASSPAKFCAAVVPVSRMVCSTLPRKTLAVRTWVGPPPPPAAGRGAGLTASR